MMAKVRVLARECFMSMEGPRKDRSVRVCLCVCVEVSVKGPKESERLQVCVCVCARVCS